MIQHLSPSKRPFSPPLPDLGRILLAEASPLISRLMVDKLQRFCRRVDVALDGQEAIMAILRVPENEPPFDLVLMDSELPMENGLCTIRRLRQLSYTGPVIAITARGDEFERMQATDSGCDDVVAKPIHWDRLIAAISRLTSDRGTSETPEPCGQIASETVD
jgi:DNA-binding response OmpR family regulator